MAGTRKTQTPGVTGTTPDPAPTAEQDAAEKAATRDDILAAMRTPPQLLGIILNNTGGFGSITEAQEVHWNAEIKPLMQRIANPINEWLGVKVIDFSHLK